MAWCENAVKFLEALKDSEMSLTYGPLQRIWREELLLEEFGSGARSSYYGADVVCSSKQR